jgi:hypothetical protein
MQVHFIHLFQLRIIYSKFAALNILPFIYCPDGGMVDTQDLKSCDHCGCAGSSPAPGTKKERE